MYIKELICGWLICMTTLYIIIIIGRDLTYDHAKSFHLMPVDFESKSEFNVEVNVGVGVIKNNASHIIYDFDTFNEDNHISLNLQYKNKFNTDNFILFTTYVINNIKRNVTIMVRLSSAGGSSYEYEKLYQYVRRLHNYGYNTIAFIDDICASGCYMMAAGFSKIYASKTAKVGSIGVIYEDTNYDGLYKMLQISKKIYTAGRYKGKSENAIEHSIQKTYDMFKYIVMYGRKINKNEIDEIATGELWYADEAKQLKLIDKIVLLDDYIYQLISDNKKVYYVTYN